MWSPCTCTLGFLMGATPLLARTHMRVLLLRLFLVWLACARALLQQVPSIPPQHALLEVHLGHTQPTSHVPRARACAFSQVAPPLLQAAHTHATPSPSATTAAAPTSSSSIPSAGTGQQSNAGDDDADAPLPPLPLVETLGCLAAAFAHCRQPLAPRQAASGAGSALAAGAGKTDGMMGVDWGKEDSRGAELVACTGQVLGMPLPWQQVRCFFFATHVGEGVRGGRGYMV